MATISTSDNLHTRTVTIDETATVQILGGGKVVQTIATSPANTIAVTGRFAYLTGAGISTCALALGTIDGQDLTIVNVGAANTIASGSGVAAAVTMASGVGCQSFIYDATTTLWYHKA